MAMKLMLEGVLLNRVSAVFAPPNSPESGCHWLHDFPVLPVLIQSAAVQLHDKLRKLGSV